MGRGDLTDAERERLRPFPPISNRRCVRCRDHRQVIDGILHRVRTGVHWRDLPERFGPWKTAYERHRRRTRPGTSAGTPSSTPPSSGPPARCRRPYRSATSS
ncbi:transposase [Kitasatospora purpeofusca]|uniref:transposase n=1 Tax=Kitasatospora purpeofusca TaxID=67352 RepID=UPI0036E1A1D2